MARYEFHPTPLRSYIMKQVKSKETKPEMKLRKALWDSGIKGYRKNYSKLPGKPDIVLMKNKVAIFVDGGFWHGFDFISNEGKIKSNRDYWLPKIQKNIENDVKINQALILLGFKVLRFWDKDINRDIDKCIESIKSELSPCSFS